MHKCLYLLCPTDCLETTINNTFKYENYFYTSLGNSFVSDIKTVKCIKELVQKHHIKEIYFVLAKDNKIVLDALGDQSFSKITGLNNFYTEIEKQHKRSKIVAQSWNRQFSMISYYLNKKIKTLQLELNNVSNEPIKISGKMYNKYQNAFTDIFSDLVCLEQFHLN